LENLSHDNRDHPLIAGFLKSIQIRLVSQVLIILETTVWNKTEYFTRVNQLSETLDSLEMELLSQYQSNRLISTNPSFEAVKKRFENWNILWNNKYNVYL